MKWSEAIAKIDWNDPKQVEDWVTVERMAVDLGFPDYDSGYYSQIVQDRFDEVWLKRWLCTDTYVGARAYFLDKELVAISWQNARKNDEYFYYVSQETADKMVEFIRSLQETFKTEVWFADLEEEIPE